MSKTYRMLVYDKGPWRKIKLGRRTESIKEMHAAILNRMTRADLAERVTSEQRPDRAGKSSPRYLS